MIIESNKVSHKEDNIRKIVESNKVSVREDKILIVVESNKVADKDRIRDETVTRKFQTLYTRIDVGVRSLMVISLGVIDLPVFDDRLWMCPEVGRENAVWERRERRMPELVALVGEKF